MGFRFGVREWSKNNSTFWPNVNLHRPCNLSLPLPFNRKQSIPDMKLPKTLLSAILLGIAVQTTTSCGKDKLPDPKKQEANDDKKKTVDPCPACGMG
jgi:hypothetical protein